MKPRHLAFVFLSALVATAQTPSSSTIRGMVVKWGTDEPIAQATVELRNAADPSGRMVMATATTQNGEYAFTQVPAGRYRIIATKKEYASGEYGKKRLSGTGIPLDVASGQAITNRRVEMAAGGVISGRVSYPSGEPMSLVRVQVSKLSYRNALPELTAEQTTYTNDLGEYRLFWVLPGIYYVSAENAQNNTGPQLLVNPSGSNVFSSTQVFGASRPTARILRDLGTGEGQTYVRIYYPGSPAWETASPIELHSGEEVRGINISLSPVAERRLSGVVIDNNRQPVEGAITVSLRQLDAGVLSGTRVLQFFPNSGKFDFRVTQPGSYELIATMGNTSGRTVATVRESNIEVSITLLPPTKLEGRLTFDQGPPTGRVTVQLRAANGPSRNSPISANGDFLFENVTAATYRLGATIPDLPDAYVKSIVSGNINLLNNDLLVDGFAMEPVQMIIGRVGGTIEGHALDEKQQPASGGTVVVLPDGTTAYDPARFRSAVIDNSGAFQFRGLPPGEYNVYAWDDVDDGAWLVPTFLRNYENYRRAVKVSEGERQSVQIPTAPIAR